MKMNVGWVWIKNSDGKPDTMLSFALVAFILVFVKVLLGGVALHIAGQVYTLTPIDAGTIGALLTPTLTAYVARRYTDRKFIDANNNGINDDDEKK
jgi:hypothetical protein